MIKINTKIITNDLNQVYTDFKTVVMVTVEWIWRKKIYLTMLFLLFCGVFGWRNYVESIKNAKMVLTLNYEQAAEGLNPNQTRFSISEIKMNEVMDQAISYAGLEGKVTPETLAKCVSIRATNNSGKSSEYISTSYSIHFKNKGCIGKIRSDDMLKLICKAYKDNFMKNHADNQEVLKYPMDDLSEEEYLMAADKLRIRANQLEKYAGNRLKELKNYVNQETGVSFSSINRDLENYRSIDLKNLESLILENGIARDKLGVVAILRYKQQQDQKKYDESMAGYRVRNESIAMYDKAMSAIVMIPTRDTIDEYYMSRTKTEMDSLARNADSDLEQASGIKSLIINDGYTIEKLCTINPTADIIDKAERMIAAQENYLDSIAANLLKLDTEYLHYRTKDYLAFESEGLTLKDRVQLDDAVLDAVFAMIAVIVLRIIMIVLIKQRRKDKVSE